MYFMNIRLPIPMVATALLLVAASCFPTAACGQETVTVTEENLSEPDSFYPLSGSEKKLIADRIASHNTPWKKVQLNGKISIDGLPVRPSLKVYMEHEKKILISVRAPFIGEAVRIEADRDEIVAVNKIKQTYWKADPRELFDSEPKLISELQSILLGRLALLGSGEFKGSDADKVEIVQQQQGDFLVIPEESFNGSPVSIGYSVSALGALENIIAVYTGFDGYFDLSFRRAGERLQINGQIEGGKRPYGAVIELDAPEWESKGFGKLKIPSTYRQVSFREVVRFN